MRTRRAAAAGVVSAMVALALATERTPVGAQGQRGTASPSAVVVALTGARVIDGTGRAPLESATVLINNGRNQAVGAPSAVTIPAGATRVDLSGKTIMPGLINAHGHLNSTTDWKIPIRDQFLQRLRLNSDYGITTIFNLGSFKPADDDPVVLALRDEQEQGPLDRARVYTAGHVFGAAPGNGPPNYPTLTPDEARRTVDRLADLKVDLIKIRIDSAPTDSTPETYAAVIDEAHARGLRVAVHLFYLKDAKFMLEKGVDILAHSVRDQDVDQAFIATLMSRNIPYIPTLTREVSVFGYETRPAFFDDPFFRRGLPLYSREVEILSDPARQEAMRNNPAVQAFKKALQQATRNLKSVSDAGGQIAFGTDTGAAGGSGLSVPGRWQGYFEHVELEMMVQAALTPMQALVAATSGAAKAMKLDGQLGTIAPGKWADLLVLNANPLIDIKNTRQINSVWIAGRRLMPSTGTN
jgi:imidazolonepropionase-like amidohydrolase